MALNKKISSKKANSKKASAKKTATKKAALRQSKSTQKLTPPKTESVTEYENRMAFAEKDQTKVHSIRHFPVTMFAGILGLVGLGLAWRQAAVVLGWPSFIGEIICWFAGGYALAIYLLYAIKIIRHPDHIRDDFSHPVRSNFSIAPSIGLMLLASVVLPYSTFGAEILWIFGVALTALLTLIIIKGWFNRQTIIEQMTPAWFMSPVGVIVMPIAGYALGYDDISWMMMGIGLIFWISLFAIFFNRQLVNPSISSILRPTLFILIAPPSLFAIGFSILEDGYMNDAAKMMYGIALFTALLMLVKIKYFIGIAFGMAWWSCAFPMTALSTASLLYHDHDGGGVSSAMAQILLFITTIIVIYLLLRTFSAFARGKLFRAPAD